MQIDPDLVDVRIILSVAGERVATHSTDDWLLHVYESEGHCEYPRARLVFSNEDGSLFELSQVESLVGGTGELQVEITSPEGGVSADFDILFSHVKRRD